MNYCKELNRKGERCKNHALDGEDYCYYHSTDEVAKFIYRHGDTLVKAIVEKVSNEVALELFSALATRLEQGNLVPTNKEKQNSFTTGKSITKAPSSLKKRNEGNDNNIIDDWLIQNDPYSLYKILPLLKLNMTYDAVSDILGNGQLIPINDNEWVYFYRDKNWANFSNCYYSYFTKLPFQFREKVHIQLSIKFNGNRLVEKFIFMVSQEGNSDANYSLKDE